MIKEEVNKTPDAKVSPISLNTNKSFLVKHLFNDSGDDSCKVFKVHQLEEIHDKFIVLSSLNVPNLVALFKHHLGGGYILELKSNNHYNFIQECYFPS